MKNLFTLMAGLFMAFLFTTGCDQPDQTEMRDDERMENENRQDGVGREATSPEDVDQERNTPVSEEATEEIELEGDTNNRDQQQQNRRRN